MKCSHPDHNEQENCEDRAIGCSKHCVCCMGESAIPTPVAVEDKWNEAAFEMAQFVHAECKDVPHDIGLKLMDIIEKHYTLK